MQHSLREVKSSKCVEEEGIFLKIFCQDLITFIPASQAYALLDIYEGSFVLAMLNFLRIHQISKPSAFKVQSHLRISYSLLFLYNISKSRSFLASRS